MVNSESEEQLKFCMLRLADIDKQPHKILMPISGYEDLPLVSLEHAVTPLISLIPDIQKYAHVAKQNCNEPADGLTRDESAAIMLHTMNWEPIDKCLYFKLNEALRSKDRVSLKPWFLFLKLFLTAFHKLPSISHRTVYRGCRLDLKEYYKAENTVIWWGFSTCTPSIRTLEAEHIVGKTGTRTLFVIECYSGKYIGKHSYYSSDDEIILILPATQFIMTSCSDVGSGLCIVNLKEMTPIFTLLKPVKIDIAQAESGV
ncbi:unnamed protein product, partial [Rotaria sp. Silwood2]